MHDDVAVQDDAAVEDAWLITKVLAGNLEAFEVLVHRHEDRIYRVALRTLGNREDAEDVSQDVVMQLWTGLAAFTGSSSFPTWLHRIVVNRCLNRIRARRPTTALPHEDEPQYPRGADTEGRVQDRAEVASATRAVNALTPELRAVFVLCQLEGLSYREVAAVRGVSEATVRGRLARARTCLTHAMREWT